MRARSSFDRQSMSCSKKAVGRLRRVVQKLKNAEAIQFREFHMLGFIDHGVGCAKRMSLDEIRKVGVLQCYGPHDPGLV